MSIWNWFRREPVYSELGQRLYDLLVDPNEDWQWESADTLYHPIKHITLVIGTKYGGVLVGFESVTDTLTDYDRIKICTTGKALIDKFRQELMQHKVDLLAEALDKKGVS